MPAPSHGTNLTLAPTIGPLVRAGGLSVRAALSAVGRAGFPAVQLDASLPGVRPRELDAGARRDLVLYARRAGVAIAGVDLFIPRQHLTDPEHLDRAVEALVAAARLAGDVGRVPLSAALPIAELHPDVAEALSRAADAAGVRLVVYAATEHGSLLRWLSERGGVAGLGLDPADGLAANLDPVETAQGSLDVLTVARLSDAERGSADGQRLPAGAGDLDLSTYRVSIDLAAHRLGPVVLDLRGLSDPAQAMARGRAAWEQAAVKF